MKRTIETSRDEAEKIMNYIYDADKSAVFGGEWNTRRYVYGNAITASFDAKTNMLEITSGAISTEAGMDEYLPGV